MGTMLDPANVLTDQAPSFTLNSPIGASYNPLYKVSETAWTLTFVSYH